MNAIEFLNELTDNGEFSNHTVDDAYDLYLTKTDEPSSPGFFKAKFNARKRKLDVEVTPVVKTEVIVTPKEEEDEVPESNKLEVGPTPDPIDSEIEEEELVNVDSGLSKKDVEVIVEAIEENLEPTEALVELSEEYNNKIDFSNITPEDVSKMSSEEYSAYKEYLNGGSRLVLEDIPVKKCPTAEMIVSQMENAKIDYYEEPEQVTVASIVKEAVEKQDKEIRGLEIVNYRDGRDLPDLPGLIPTGTIFDRIVCDRVTSDEDRTITPAKLWERGGFTRKCCDVVAGGAGSGKTYSRTMLACMAKQINPSLRIGFISAEMREVEWVKEVKSAPILADLEVVYMLSYVGQPNYESVFYEAIGMFDIVIVDSFPAIISHIKMAPKEKRNDKQITFDLIREINLSVDSNNNNIQLINQATKDGNYKGGTELPHMMSSQSFVRVEGQKRYMEFDKNRNNGNTIRRKVYFTKNPTTGLLEFDVDVYVATYETVEDTKQTVAEFFKTVQERAEKDEVEEDSGILMSDKEMEEKEAGSNQMDLETMIEEVEQEAVEI